MSILEFFDVTTAQLLLMALTALLIGMGKVGVQGVNLLMIPVMASILGGRNSAGFILPLLIEADVFAVIYYHRKCEWKYVFKLIPWALGGIAIGLLTGHLVTDEYFKKILAGILLICLGLMIWQELKKAGLKIPDHWSLHMATGLSGGFATMIGNAAGPIMALYLLSMRLPKAVYIGTGAWYFFIMNLTKVPLHVFIWKTITVRSILLNLSLWPAIIAGAFLGVMIVKVIPEKAYRYFVILMTLATTIRLFFS